MEKIKKLGFKEGIKNMYIEDKVVEATKEQRIALRKEDGYKILSKLGLYEELRFSNNVREDDER